MNESNIRKKVGIISSFVYLMQENPASDAMHFNSMSFGRFSSYSKSVLSLHIMSRVRFMRTSCETGPSRRKPLMVYQLWLR